MSAPRTFTTDDGSVYEGVPAAEFPDGDTWDSAQVDAEIATRQSLISVTSQNGWTANDRSVIASYTIPGTKTRLALRAGDCSVLLLDFMAWYNVAIEPIDGGVLDDWGYAERTIRGSTTELSNHASGTAADANATKHPLGTHTLSKPDLAKVKQRLTVYRGALRHGAFYTGRVDEMHVEINAGPTLVREVADDIRAGRLGGTPTSEEDFMAALSDDKQIALYEAVMGMNGAGRNNFNYLDDRIRELAGPLTDVRKALYGNMPEGQNNFHWLASVLLTAIAANGSAEVSADAIAAAIPADIAEQVAQKLADRLAA